MLPDGKRECNNIDFDHNDARPNDDITTSGAPRIRGQIQVTFTNEDRLFAHKKGKFSMSLEAV